MRASVRRAVEGVEVVYHIAATYREAGQPDSAYRAINVDGTQQRARRGAGRRRARASCTAAPAACTATSSIRRPTRTRRSIPATSIRRPSSKPRTLAREFGASTGLDVVVARPIGIYGPGDTRFLKMFRGLARGRFPMIGSGQAFYHLTYIDDLIEGFRLCGTVPAAAGRTYILAGPRYTTLEQLVQLVAKELKVAPPRVHLPVWPFWTAGLLCEMICVPLRIEPPIYRRRVDFYTKSRAFDTTRARTELGYSPEGRSRRGHPAHGRLVSERGTAVSDPDPGSRIPDPLNVVHICDHLGWEGSRMHGVKRLFAWMIPRFDKSRFNVSLISLRKKDLSDDTLEEFGIDVTYMARHKFDPATFPALLKVLREKHADIVHLHGYGATTFGRLCAWRMGIPAILHEHANHTTRRGSRRSPIACWRRTPTWRSPCRNRPASSRRARD